MVRNFGRTLLALTVLLGGTGIPAATQTVESFEHAVELARQAWLRHDIRGLLTLSDTIRLQLPDGNNLAIRPHHAERVLKEYLKEARELAMALRSIRSVSDDHRYAELIRRFVVLGTEDERVQTVFLGLRWGSEGWAIREVRINP